MAFLKKNKFWIANFVLVAGMVGVWFYATAALKAATAKRVGELNSVLSAVEDVSKVSAEEGIAAHPNQQTEEGMDKKLSDLADSVIEAWKIRYDSQQNTMEWPREILFGQTGQAFIDEFEKYHPPETLPAEEKGKSEKMQPLLRVYKQQIPSQMKNICAIIKSDWRYQDELDAAVVEKTEDDASADEEGGDEDDADEKEKERKEAFDSGRQIVMWSEKNQELWYRKLTDFRGRDDNEFSVDLPTPSQVYMLQQDLWLLEAMFDIIRTVNARMDENGKMMMGDDNKPLMVLANDLAPVKKIDHVVFGREALSLLGEIFDSMNNTTSNAGDSIAAARSQARKSKRGTSSASDLDFAYRGQPAFHGRYVNSNLEPIEADTIRKVLTDKALPADNLELVVAKRVPVRLAVQMDERKIPQFLAACANSPFAFEVWQVRINKHDPDEEIKLRGKEGGSKNSGRGRGRGAVGATGGNAGGLAAPAAGPATPVDVAIRKNYDVGVEFYGVVKIYNPVNEELLDKEKPSATATP